MIITFTTSFKVKLIKIPEIEDKKTKQISNMGSFTIGKKYQVYSVFSIADSEAGFTDFLVADDSGVFYWISTSFFRAK